MTDGIESFEITDWDLENEFNPERVRHQLTKKQQIYGVFADDVDSDGDEQQRPGFGGSKYNYPTSINFISGGVRVVGKKDETKKNSDEDEAGSSDDEVVAKPSTSYKNTTYQRSGFSGQRKSNQMAGLRSLQAELEPGFGSWEKHTKGIGQKLLRKMGYEPGKGLGKALQGITTPIEAKLRKGKGAIGLYGPESSMKRIESESKIIDEDSKDEEKERFQRQRQWKKKPGEKHDKTKYIYKTTEDVAIEGSKTKFRGDSVDTNSVKVIDMTGPEQRILSGYHQIHSQHSKPPEEEIDKSELKSSIGYHFSLPELEHNLKLLEEEGKRKIIRSDHQRQFAGDQIVNLEHEEKRLIQVLNQEEKQLKTLDKVLNIIESMNTDVNSDESNANLEIAAKTFRDLQENYYEEYKLFNLSDLAITIVVPLTKKLLENWNPFTQLHHCIDVFQDWKDLLESGKQVVAYSKGADDEMDPYMHLIWEVWMPPVRTAILNWNVREWNPVIQLLETWMPLLPPWILSNILEQLVLPRLQAEVENWNPLTDTVPVHSWLHPWLPLMGIRMEPLYAPIRQKLSSALLNWHPSDCSAKLILEPWKSVFSQGTMDAFIVNNIVPKLVLVLQQYVINPHQQHLVATVKTNSPTNQEVSDVLIVVIQAKCALESLYAIFSKCIFDGLPFHLNHDNLYVWTWVMSWSDMIPDQYMVSILEKNFFPRWLQVLYTWLSHNPNYEEITKWYTGWKSMLPSNLMNNPIIKAQFKQALDIMNTAVSSPQGLLGNQPGAKESMAYLTNVEKQQEFERNVRPRRDYEAIMQTVVQGRSSVTDITLSFKELIQKKAEQSNIIFMPVPGRYQEGKQVHRFGSSLLYIDSGVIFVYNQKTWVPTSLQSLLDMAG